MASTSYLSRVIYKAVASSNDSLAGTYKLLCNAKSIPSPMGTPNTVESTTLEDSSQTFEEGIKTSDAIEVTGNLEKADFQALADLSGKQHFMFLYGTDGIGSVLKIARDGSVAVSPSDVGGTDEILEMSVTITPSTQAEVVTDKYTVTYDATNKEFTVTAV